MDKISLMDQLKKDKNLFESKIAPKESKSISENVSSLAKIPEDEFKKVKYEFCLKTIEGNVGISGSFEHNKNFLTKNTLENLDLIKRKLNLLFDQNFDWKEVHGIKIFKNSNEWEIVYVGKDNKGNTVYYYNKDSGGFSHKFLYANGHTARIKGNDFIEGSIEEVSKWLKRVKFEGTIRAKSKGLDISSDESIQIDAVKRKPENILKIDNPSKKVQLAAVNRNGYVIRYIKNPDEEVQLAAVKSVGPAIEYIKNPSKEVQLAAVKSVGSAIEYIKNPSEEVKLEAVKNLGTAIKFINNPSEELKREAIKSSRGTAIELIDNPSEELQLLAIEIAPIYKKPIQYIKNPSELVKRASIKKSPESIEHIKPQTLELAKLAYEMDPETALLFNLDEIFKDLPEEEKILYKLEWNL